MGEETSTLDWLALREPVDHRSRAADLVAPLAEWWGSRPVQRVLDLGSGTGSNLRYLAPRLAGEQEWTLVDRDAALLDQATGAAVAVAGVARVKCVPGELGAPELDTLYHSASLFVLATHYEGYGMVLAEALARGLPVVSTRAGAVPDTVPPEAGVLVPPGDERALTAALHELVSGPGGAERRAELAEGSLRHGRSLPTWDDAALAFERAVRELSPGE